jgi:hypothetical protein
MRLNTLFILDGKIPVRCPDMIEWGNWMETANRIVRREEVGDYTVSTVFLGIDHAFGGGVPILFETMVFSDGTSVEDIGMRRCSTWEGAEKQHREIVLEVEEIIRNHDKKGFNHPEQTFYEKERNTCGDP